MKTLLPRLLLVILFCYGTFGAQAIESPFSTSNNHFGIHILNQSDILQAKELVNSNGGDWGYVTFVIREDQRNVEEWQRFFDELRSAHLIPIVRLATRFENGAWIKPRAEDIEPWVVFFEQLNWVTKNRYIILFNEPNHSKEWGGEIKPQEYAKVHKQFYTALKEASPDYFIMGAGLDVAPETTALTMHPQSFFEEMYESVPEIFSYYDGWSSHAYPNPGFISSPTNTGRLSIQSYLWEMNVVEKFGYDTSKPIFITETGWRSGVRTGGLSEETISRYLNTAFTEIWDDDRIVAITPFVLSYLEAPFSEFSWIDPDSEKPRSFYKKIQELPKISAKPTQLYQSDVTHRFFPRRFIKDRKYLVAVRFKNTGQAIWTDDLVSLEVNHDLGEGAIEIDKIQETKPFDELKVWISIETPSDLGNNYIQLQLAHDGQSISPLLDYEIEITTDNYVERLRLWFEQRINQNLK